MFAQGVRSFPPARPGSHDSRNGFSRIPIEELKGSASKLTARGLDGRVRVVELAQVDDLKIGVVAIPPQKFAVFELRKI